MAENSLLYTDFRALSLVKPELLPIEVLRWGDREISIFLVKSSGKY